MSGFHTIHLEPIVGGFAVDLFVEAIKIVDLHPGATVWFEANQVIVVLSHYGKRFKTAGGAYAMWQMAMQGDGFVAPHDLLFENRRRLLHELKCGSCIKCGGFTGKMKDDPGPVCGKCAMKEG